MPAFTEAGYRTDELLPTLSGSSEAKTLPVAERMETKRKNKQSLLYMYTELIDGTQLENINIDERDGIEDKVSFDH